MPVVRGKACGGTGRVSGVGYPGSTHLNESDLMRSTLLPLLLLFTTVSLAQPATSTAPATAPAATQPNPTAVIQTNHGPITVELYADAAPATVANFVGLAEGTKAFKDPESGEERKQPFYDGVVFHRVIPNFMIQGGDPLGTGTGGPGYRFADEINADALGLHEVKAFDDQGNPHPNLGIRSQQQFQQLVLLPIYQKLGINSQETFEAKREQFQAEVEKLRTTATLKDMYELQGYKYTPGLPSKPPVRGALAMANSGPNTNGSQFFINVADTPWLTGKHTVFGRVVTGMDIVDKISRVPTGNGNRPNEPVVIESIKVKR